MQAERAEGRRVMVYVEQQQRSMAERLRWLLPEFEPWTLPDSVKAENREDAIRQAVQTGHTVVIVPFLRVAEGLNLQDVLDTIIWAELPKNLFTLDQASRRIWRLNKREPVRLYYLAYAGTAGHRKLRKLASMSGAAALFAGQTPDGQLIRSVGAHNHAGAPEREPRCAGRSSCGLCASGCGTGSRVGGWPAMDRPHRHPTGTSAGHHAPTAREQSGGAGASIPAHR